MECNLTKTEVLDILDLISVSRMEIEEENLGILKVMEKCFVNTSTMGMQLWKQLCWRLGLDARASLSLNALSSTFEYHVPDMLQHMAAEDDPEV